MADEDLDNTNKVHQTLLEIERPENIDLYHKEQTPLVAPLGPLTEISDLLSSQSYLIFTRLDISNKVFRPTIIIQLVYALRFFHGCHV